MTIGLSVSRKAIFVSRSYSLDSLYPSWHLIGLSALNFVVLKRTVDILKGKTTSLPIYENCRRI